MFDLGRVLVVLGVGLVVVGGALVAGAGAGVGLGRLPGDLRWESHGLHVYAPLATCLLASVAATLLLNIFLRR
jgi:hypothetical protein